MAAMFACTRCHDRVPFEQLSKAEQYCKKCLASKSQSTSLGKHSFGKCSYCRGEYPITDKSTSASLCKQCAQSIKVHGKPSACKYCSVIAAFTGKHCQRCMSAEKRYGAPRSCDQCKQVCAFDMGMEQRKKTDNKLLCYLCTVTFKRVLAKTRKLDWVNLSSRENTPVGTPDEQKHKHKHHHSHHHHKHKKDHHRHHHKHHKHHHRHHGDKSSSTSGKKHHHRSVDAGAGDEPIENADENESPPAKKPSLEKTGTSSSGSTTVATNGASSATGGGGESNMFDLGNTDHMVAMTQLKEEVESLKKQLVLKEQTLLEKDKKLTELKASNYESEKLFRTKLQNAQKDSAGTIESLQAKNRDLQKQVAALSKGKKVGSD